MKIKNLFLSIFGLAMLFNVASCGDIEENPTIDNPEGSDGQPQETVNLNKKELKITSLSSEIDLDNSTMTAYFKDDGHVPYVAVKDFIDGLSGYFKSHEYEYFDNGSIVKYETFVNNESLYFNVDTVNDVIKTNSSNFFSNSNTFDSCDLVTPRHNYIKDVKVVDDGLSEITFDLKKYDLEIFKVDDEAVLPLSALNSIALLSSLNTLLYNQNELFYYYGYVDSCANLYDTRNKSIEGTEIPEDLLVNRNNSLYFTMDYFYGLKEDAKVDSYKEYIESRSKIINPLNSRDPNDISKAMSELIYKGLDDPHTAIGMKSFYQEANSKEELGMKNTADGPNERINSLYVTNDALNKSYYEAFGVDNDGSVPLRFEGSTAFIKFNGFNYNPTVADQKDEDGNIPENILSYDTPILLRETLKKVAKNEKITNVVLDLSNNTGGIVNTIFPSIDIISDDEVKLAGYNSVSKKVTEGTIKTDIEPISYPQYNYFILTSAVSFSSANTFTSICKDNGLAYVIGQKSGGGSCTVGDYSMIDGSNFTLSSPGHMMGYSMDESGNFSTHSIEYGVELDLEIPLEKFFDLSFIDQTINNALA